MPNSTDPNPALPEPAQLAEVSAPPSRKKIIQYFRGADEFSVGKLMHYWEAFRQPAFYDHEQLTAVLTGIHNSIVDPGKREQHSNLFCRRPELEIWFDRHAALPSHDPALMATNWKSMRRLHIRPPHVFRQDTWNLHDLSGLNTNEITELLYAPARLGLVMPRDFVAKVISCVGKNIDEFSSKNLTRLCWSIGFLAAATGSKEFNLVFEMLSERAKERIWHPTDYHMLSIISPLFDREFDIQEEGVHYGTISPWENSLRRQFNLNGYEDVSEELHYCRTLRRHLDLRFTRDGKDFIVEADGPHHHCYDYDRHDMRFNGSTIVQTAVMRKLYPDSVILRLNYRHCRDVPNETREQKDGKTVATLTALFNQCAPDAYETCLDDKKLALRQFFGGGDKITLPEIKEENTEIRRSLLSRIHAVFQNLCLR